MLCIGHTDCINSFDLVQLFTLMPFCMFNLPFSGEQKKREDFYQMRGEEDPGKVTVRIISASNTFSISRGYYAHFGIYCMM